MCICLLLVAHFNPINHFTRIEDLAFLRVTVRKYDKRQTKPLNLKTSIEALNVNWPSHNTSYEYSANSCYMQYCTLLIWSPVCALLTAASSISTFIVLVSMGSNGVRNSCDENSVKISLEFESKTLFYHLVDLKLSKGHEAQSCCYCAASTSAVCLICCVCECVCVCVCVCACVPQHFSYLSHSTTLAKEGPF